MNLIIILASIGLILLVWIGYKYLQSEKREDIDTLYTRGLDHMIRDENEEAINCFREYVKRNTEKIDVYLKLGMLLRKEGKSEKGLNIHRSLLYRQNISKSQRQTILIQMVEDYRSMDKLEKALDTVEKILNIEEKNHWAEVTAWKLCRDLGKWDQAFDYLQKITEDTDESNQRLLSIYKTRQGVSQLEKNILNQARQIFKNALEYDDECEAPLYYMAESYLKGDKPKKAVKWWKEYIKISPTRAYYFYPKIRKTLFEMGKFDKLSEIYEEILEREPDHPETTLALAQYLDRRGEKERAITMVKNIINSNPDYIKAKLSLLKLIINGDLHQAQELINEVIEDIQESTQIVCYNCGYNADKIHWICPNCGEIDTYFKS